MHAACSHSAPRLLAQPARAGAHRSGGFVRDPRAPLPHTWQSLLSTGDRGPGPHEERGGSAWSALDVGRAAWLACFGLVIYAPTNHFWFAFQERHVTAFKSRWYHALIRPCSARVQPALVPPARPSLPPSFAHSAPRSLAFAGSAVFSLSRFLSLSCYVRVRVRLCVRESCPCARLHARELTQAAQMALNKKIKITKVHEQSQKTQTSRTGGPSRRRAFSRLCALFCSGVRGVGGAARGFGFHCPPCQAEHLQAVGQWHHLLG